MSRILNSAFVWIGSATHDTSDAFRQRQRDRIRRMQNNGVGAEIAARQCAQANPTATLAEDGSRRGPPGQCKSDPTPPIRRMQNDDKGPEAPPVGTAGTDRERAGPESPFKDSRADMDQRGEDLRKKAEMVAAIYERAFARKEGK